MSVSGSAFFCLTYDARRLAFDASLSDLARSTWVDSPSSAVFPAVPTNRRGGLQHVQLAVMPVSIGDGFGSFSVERRAAAGDDLAVLHLVPSASARRVLE